jgi:hypothetical protein
MRERLWLASPHPLFGPCEPCKPKDYSDSLWSPWSLWKHHEPRHHFGPCDHSKGDIPYYLTYTIKGFMNPSTRPRAKERPSSASGLAQLSKKESLAADGFLRDRREHRPSKDHNYHNDRVGSKWWEAGRGEDIIGAKLALWAFPGLPWSFQLMRIRFCIISEALTRNHLNSRAS